MFFLGGVLCRFSVGVKESERQRRRHALTHRSLHVQGTRLSPLQSPSMKPWKSKIKCEVSPNLNNGDYDIEIE